jgi:competence protein ComGD
VKLRMKTGLLFHPAKIKIHDEEGGYSLVEMMVVLFIVGMISAATFLILKPAYEHKEIEAFFNELQKDILYAQAYAMSHNSHVYVRFDLDKSTYWVEAQGPRQALLRRSYSEKIKMEQLTLTFPIKFYPNGNNPEPGKFYVYFKEDIYAVTFNLGKGRFNVKKL